MRAQVLFHPLQGTINSSSINSARIYEAWDPISNSSQWAVLYKKDVVAKNWYFNFITPSFTINNANSQIRLRWRSSNATSGSPFFHILKENFTDGLDVTNASAATTVSVSGMTFLGQGIVHETVLQFLGANSIVASIVQLYRVQRSNNVGDTLDGDVELLNVLLEFDTDSSQKKQFVWIPITAMRPMHTSSDDSIYQFAAYSGAAGDSWPGLIQNPNIYNYAITYIITPENFGSPINVITGFRTGEGSTDTNIYKISACSLPIGTVATSGNLPFIYEVSNIYTQAVANTRVKVYNNALTGFIDGGGRQLFLRIARQGDEAGDSIHTSYILGATIEWSTDRLMTAIPLMASTSSITPTGRASMVEIKDILTYSPTDWLTLHPIGKGVASISFSIPDNYNRNGRFKIYYSFRDESTTGTVNLQISLAVTATGALVDTVAVSSITISLSPGLSPNNVLEYVDTRLSSVLTPCAIATMTITRENSPLQIPIYLSEILLEYQPTII